MLNGQFSKKEATERTLHYLDSVGLSGFGDRKPGNYRANNSVSLLPGHGHEPMVVIADEPTGNLDLATGEAILDLLLTINQQQAPHLLFPRTPAN